MTHRSTHFIEVTSTCALCKVFQWVELLNDSPIINPQHYQGSKVRHATKLHPFIFIAHGCGPVGRDVKGGIVGVYNIKATWLFWGTNIPCWYTDLPETWFQSILVHSPCQPMFSVQECVHNMQQTSWLQLHLLRVFWCVWQGAPQIQWITFYLIFQCCIAWGREGLKQLFHI